MPDASFGLFSKSLFYVLFILTDVLLFIQLVIYKKVASKVEKNIYAYVLRTHHQPVNPCPRVWVDVGL